MKTLYCRGIVTLYALFACIFLKVHGQENHTPDMIPPSPTAAALGKYGEVPVSLYTGIPGIGIPLWNIQSRDISLPVSLSYHAGGIKVEDIAPWTGLGWSLNAGGLITRTVRGLPDELPNGYLNNVVPAANTIDEQADYNYLYAVSDGAIDTESDFYFYNFAGRTGKFLFEENGTIHSIPYEPIKIEKISDYRFEITDEKGVKYVFGTSLSGEDACEVSSPSGHNNIAAPFVSSWFLTDIISPSGTEAITLKYNSAGGHVTQPSTYEAIYQPIANNLFCMLPPEPIFSSVVTVINKAMKISEITWPDGRMTFLRDGNRSDLGTANLDYKLTSVVVYDRSNQEMKRFDLAYSYFNNTASDLKKKRLKLLSVTEKAPNGETKPPFSFTYEESVALPSRSSKQQDHWGFFNGIAYNDNINSLIPTISIGTQVITGADRTPNFNYTKAGTLTQVTYPTGGYSRYEYELNNYDGGNAGGLRVKKVTTHDGNDPAKDMIRTFVYENPANPGISSGKLVRPIPPYHEIITFILDDPGTTLPGLTIECAFYKLSSNSTYALGTTQGGTVGYTHVSEIYGVNGSNGKTEYEFAFIPDFDIESSMDWHRGQMLHKTDYARTTTGFRKVNEIINTFNFSGSPFLEHNILSLHVKPHKIGIQPFTGPAVSYLGLFDFWESSAQSRWVILTQSIERAYNDNGVDFLEKKVEYTYDNYRHGQPTRTTVWNSDGRVTVSKQKYAMDYDPNLSLRISGGSPKVKDLLDKFMNNIVIESQIWEGTSASSLSLLSGNVREFAEVSGLPNIADKIILPSSIWQLETASPISAATFTPSENLVLPAQLYNTLIPGYQVTGKNWYKKRVDYQYDGKGNIVCQTLVHGNPIAYIWGYNHLLITAKVENAVQNEIAFSSFEDETTGNWSYTGTPTTTLAKTGIRSYALSSGNITKTSIPPGDYLLSYWAQGTVNTSLGVATANSGLDSDANGWTYIEKKISVSANSSLTLSGSGMIDELRLHPEDATMTTVTCDNQLNVTGFNSLQNLSSTFKYDPMGRLTLSHDHEGNILQRITYHFKN
ncbi:MAG: hypothetical protein SF052_14265 [Bacteroidia bacterium]|nr:hypothetical protein [Bacteroidia bacterium]